jgi:peptide/nickel transport system ATP-binding protein
LTETSGNGSDVLYRIEGVTKEFGRGQGGLVRALDGVSFDIPRGETFGLVGESGSGKTTLGRLLLLFDSPTRGRIELDGAPLADLRRGSLRAFRCRVQMIHQNPFSSLNPRRKVRSVLAAGPAIRAIPRGAAREEAMSQLLRRVGLHESMLNRYPHEFSGGQRQRIVIARALSAGPAVLVADEPVSALDVSIQAQVLELLQSLRREFGLSIVMITHDLRVVNFLCDRVGVLYRGRLVELGDRETVIERSSHPYTRMLMSAAPTGDPAASSDRPWVRGEVHSAPPPSEACVFASRCWLRDQLGSPERCTAERPEPRLLETGQLVACHFAEEVARRAGDEASGLPSLAGLGWQAAPEAPKGGEGTALSGQPEELKAESRRA